jgi:hypothetical protein
LDDLVDERLCAENDREGEAVGVFGLGFGGVDHDAEVGGGDDERVAVERDAADVRVFDDLVPPRSWCGSGAPDCQSSTKRGLCAARSRVSRSNR